MAEAAGPRPDAPTTGNNNIFQEMASRLDPDDHDIILSADGLKFARKVAAMAVDVDGIPVTVVRGYTRGTGLCVSMLFEVVFVD